jgi:HIV-1 Vpr-binding protein
LSPQPQFPHAFEDATIENLKKWIREDAQACDWKHFGNGENPTDTEMLRTYAVGLLSMSLHRYLIPRLTK